MRVFIQTQGLNLSSDDHNHIRQRLRQVLARFGEQALGATVRLRDVANARGGQDKDCELVIDMEDSTAIVHDRGSQLRALIDRVLHRATQTLGKPFSKRTAPGQSTRRSPRRREPASDVDFDMLPRST
jgi:ribosome-associated translation inhibitor RaiA